MQISKKLLSTQLHRVSNRTFDARGTIKYGMQHVREGTFDSREACNTTIRAVVSARTANFTP